MLGILLRLSTPLFIVAIREDAYDFLANYCEQLQSLGLEKSRRDDFTAHQFRGLARQWWRSYLETKSVGSPPLS